MVVSDRYLLVKRAFVIRVLLSNAVFSLLAAIAELMQLRLENKKGSGGFACPLILKNLSDYLLCIIAGCGDRI
jgi:hypothetical protein